MESLRIVFLGTPDFAVPSLKILIENSFQIVAVITAPDKPRGRGQKLVPSPIKQCALEHHIPVLQPTNLKSEEFLHTLQSYHADLQIVVAFRMLPEVVWSMPRLGTFNLHASLLPKYRGAAPINWAIINGETETGITTFLLQHAIDTGQILFQEKEPIHPDDTAGSVYNRLMHKGAQLVLKTTKALASGVYTCYPQDDSQISHAPKIYKETCEINWELPARKIHDFVRGLSPYPGAWTTLKNHKYKIFEVTEVDYPEDQQPGSMVTDHKKFIYVKAQHRWISILQLQPEGKKRMDVGSFLRGNQL